MNAKRPKTVFYLTPSARLLGARRSLLGLAQNLDPERWRAVVCGQSEGHLGAELSKNGIPFEVVKTGWWRKGKYFLWRPFAIAQLSALMRRIEADLVHCNEIYPHPYAVRAAAQAGAKLGRRIPVVTHMRLSVTPRMIRNYDLRKADRIIVPSEAAGRDFDFWPDKAQRVVAIPNGVDLSEFRRTRSPAEARRQIGVPPEGPLIAAIGQVGPRKGGDVILKAMERLAAARPDLRLMFVGNPHRGQEEFGQELERRAAAPPLAGRVFFFPYTKQILPYYEATDVNLLISRDEGFGRTVIEAGSLGVPTIATRVGGIPELILEDRTGLLIDPESDEQLAESALKLLGSPALMASMAEAVFRHVAQNFSIGSHCLKIMDLYDSLLAPPQDRA